MSAASSSSCEVVDLGLAATCDDATSQIFFSKDGSGGGDLSWPAAAEIDSNLKTQKSLLALCDRYGVPREFKPVCASVLGCAACETPPQGSNALCIYPAALEAGLRFPLHDFYLKLLRHYGLAPSQLVPNAWKFMAAFVLRCEDAGVEPRVSVFRYFFSVCAHKRKDKPLGWHHFTPCHGRPRLFSGILQNRKRWKVRFFFLKSPEGMPWKCPVAWGKPRIEDARIVKLTDVAIDKLKQMPCIDLIGFLSLHAPPIGALTQLQLHSTPMPMAKSECAAASTHALVTSPHQLHTTFEAGARVASAADAAGEGADMTWQTRRKRRCRSPGPASVTLTVTPPMPQRFSISAVPLSQGMEMTPCGTSFDGAWESSEISMPPGICSSDTLYMYNDTMPIDVEHARLQEGNRDISMPPGICLSDALDMYNALVAIDAEKAQLQDKQQAINAKAAQQIADLQSQLQQVSAENAKLMDYLVAARAEKAQLMEKYASEIAKLNQEHAFEVAKLQEEHHKASTAHAKKVKEECMAEIAKLQEKHAAEVGKLNEAHDAAVTRLMEEHEAEVARVKQAAEAEAVDVVQDAKKEIALALFPDLDVSLL